MKENNIISHFQQLYELIQNARSKAVLSVNREHLKLFWQVGAYLNDRLAEGVWGEKIVEQFEDWLKLKDTSIKNFDRRNIYRMSSFFLTYSNVQLNVDAHGLSIVGTAKPQIETAGSKGEEIVVSAKPPMQEIPSWLGKIPWTQYWHTAMQNKKRYRG